MTELAGPTVSHHLRSLREAGVVTGERRGTWIFYSLTPGMDRVASGLLDALTQAAATPPPTDDLEDTAHTDAEATLDRSAERLAARFPQLPAEVVRLVVRESYAALARTATVTTYLPVLAERFAHQRLTDQVAVADDAPRRPQVLFVCTANAGRSQLAAALLRRIAGDDVVVRSAGSMPAARVHTTVAPLLAELLADQDDEPFPKPLTDDAVRAADVVVTMGCGDSTIHLPGKRYEDWPVADPALASPEGVRAIYDDLAARVRALATDLTTTRPTQENP
jgi:arsenate reductase (thioredoxin)